ncbi:hypothetical protein Pint_28882 [Pistacia integerrima]|uniref:Uncharacterized protein n=1 Tax=Pistacia integerrima TaxID=434235 RepID=A0ACC0X1R8_9ROSI|nr:hypothetical protein Pint_28882 [Pistacia integerrima]
MTDGFLVNLEAFSAWVWYLEGEMVVGLVLAAYNVSLLAFNVMTMHRSKRWKLKRWKQYLWMNSKVCGFCAFGHLFLTILYVAIFLLAIPNMY